MFHSERPGFKGHSWVKKRRATARVAHLLRAPMTHWGHDLSAVFLRFRAVFFSQPQAARRPPSNCSDKGVVVERA